MPYPVGDVQHELTDSDVYAPLLLKRRVDRRLIKVKVTQARDTGKRQLRCLECDWGLV